MRARVVAVDPATEHGRGVAAGLERAAMGPPVDAAREAGDDDHTGRCDPARELARDVGAVVGAATGADHRDCRPAQKLRAGVPPEKEPRRRVVDRAQPLGEGAVGASEPAQPSLAEHAQVGVSIERRLESRGG